MVDTFNKLVRRANLVQIFVLGVFYDYVREVLADVPLKFVGGGVADLDRESVSSLFYTLQGRVRMYS